MTKNISNREFRRRNKIAFSIFIVAALVVVGGFFYIKSDLTESGIPRLTREVLDFNGKVGLGITTAEKIDPATFPSPKGKRARVNGDIGLTEPVQVGAWRLHITSDKAVRSDEAPRDLVMDDLFKLPKQEVTVQFRCIEGWSEIMSFGGVRFTDFLKAYHLGTKSGRDIDLENHPEDAYRFVGMQTPDGAYYVSVDMKSLMSPNALLAYEQNDAPLTQLHGAPVRLYMPNKYGVKSLKRIGTIHFTDTKPPDYWQDDGYDWFNGL